MLCSTIAELERNVKDHEHWFRVWDIPGMLESIPTAQSELDMYHLEYVGMRNQILELKAVAEAMVSSYIQVLQS